MTIHCARAHGWRRRRPHRHLGDQDLRPAAYERVVDRAIQVWGAAGVSGDLPLAAMYQGARTLRLADGPDEVHRILIAKNVLSRHHAGESWDFGN
jgi:acyl-CoA dehydrogenase